MKTATRSIYMVNLSVIANWNDGDDLPGDCDPITEIDGKDPSLATTSLIHAYHYYRECADDLMNIDDNEMVELIRISIEVPDEKWRELCGKESLSYDDYAQYLIKDSADFSLAWAYVYNGNHEDSDETPEELLRNISEAFNMHYVCDMAGVNYSTFRGFKNNHQPFSLKKTRQLLKCMKDISDECWSDDFEKAFSFLDK